MRKILDFNTSPELIVTMKDEKKTRIHVSMPTLDIVETLQSSKDAIIETLSENTQERIPELYRLAGVLMSCNKDGISVTAENLRDIYGLTLEDLTVFFSTYIDFIKAVENEKN